MSFKSFMGFGKENEYYVDNNEVEDNTEENAHDDFEEKEPASSKPFSSVFGGFKTKAAEPKVDDTATSVKATTPSKGTVKIYEPECLSDVSQILDDIKAGIFVHIRLNRLCNKEKEGKVEYTNEFLRILYAIAGCAYAVDATVFRFDDELLDFFVIPKEMGYDFPDVNIDFIEENKRRYNFK